MSLPRKVRDLLKTFHASCAVRRTVQCAFILPRSGATPTTHAHFTVAGNLSNPSLPGSFESQRTRRTTVIPHDEERDRRGLCDFMAHSSGTDEDALIRSAVKGSRLCYAVQSQRSGRVPSGWTSGVRRHGKTRQHQTLRFGKSDDADVAPRLVGPSSLPRRAILSPTILRRRTSRWLAMLLVEGDRARRDRRRFRGSCWAQPAVARCPDGGTLHHQQPEVGLKRRRGGTFRSRPFAPGLSCAGRWLSSCSRAGLPHKPTVPAEPPGVGSQLLSGSPGAEFGSVDRTGSGSCADGGSPSVGGPGLLNPLKSTTSMVLPLSGPHSRCCRRRCCRMPLQDRNSTRPSFGA